MATYVNDLRLTELATGEGSGTWGVTTNTNLELIGEALGYGTQNCFASDADATTTVADGASDPARSLYFKVTSSATLTATRTLTIAPNTVSRVMFIENATTGSQSINISQGSGANVTIATGKTAVVYLDGAGSGAAVVDAMALVDPGVTDTLAEVLTAGNTTGGTSMVISSGDDVTFTGASANIVFDSSDSALEFGDNAKAVFGAGSDLQIYHDGSGSYVSEGGVGQLFIDATNLRLRDSSGNLYLLANSGAEVQLYHNANKKLETTATGIDVTGTVTADGLTVDGDATLQTSGGTILTLGSTDTGVIAGDVYGSIHFDTADTSNAGTAGRIEVTASGSAAHGIMDFYTTFSGTQYNRLKINYDGDISFYEDTGTTAKFFWDASAESLGIGTSSPSAPLDIVSSATGGTTIELDNTSTGGRNFTLYSSGSGNSFGAGNFALYDADAAAVRMLVDSSGQVGIGTSSPSALLDVNDTGATDNAWNTLAKFRPDLSDQNAETSIHIQSYPSTTVVADRRAGIQSIDDSGNARDLVLNKDGGNVGIGTDSPTQKLHLGGTAPGDSIIRQDSTVSGTNWEIGEREAGKWQIFEDDADSVVATFTSSGNVGIGTDSPTTALTVSTDGTEQLTINRADASINTGNTVGTILFTGDDPSANQTGARIQVLAAENWATNAYGSHITFSNDSSGTITERMRIDSSGNVGIGTDSPNAKLGINASAPDFTMLQSDVVKFRSGVSNTTNGGVTGSASGDYFARTSGGKMLFSTDDGVTANAVIDSSGNVGIGVSPGVALDINRATSTASYARVGNGGNVQAYIGVAGDNLPVLGSFTNHALRFVVNTSEVARFDTSGNLLVGVTSITDATSRTFGNAFSGSGSYSNWTSWGNGTGHNHALFRNGTTAVGNISTTSSATTYNTSSDQRLKDNIVDAPSASDDIDAIQVRSFDWKADGSHQKYGMVAQELQSVAPNAVSQPEDPEEMMGVDYSKLVPMLIKEVQQLRARVAQLEGAN